MKNLAYFIFIISILASPTLNAKAKRSSICEPREPVIKYTQAIKIAKESLVKYLAVDDAFIDLVKLSCQNQKHIWIIGFRRKAYESGHLLIYLHMDGRTKTSVVKDG